MTDYKAISLDVFDADVKHLYTEVSTSALGGSINAFSDDFFAEVDNVIKIEPAASLKGQFGPIGALYDAWESRRHCATFDWIIILLAPYRSQIHYVDIDTTCFKGNECPESQVFALTLPDDESRETTKLRPNDSRWEEILPVVPLGPSSRHVFELGSKGKTGQWSAVMVRMIPDGGMARFRAFGRPLPPAPIETLPTTLATAPINLSSALLGALVVDSSDEGFSPPSNLLRPGRGIDMSDGWETRRSQIGRGKYAKGASLEGQERKEWAIIKLASAAVLKWIDVDTAYHPGNYPVACSLEATHSDDDVPPSDAQWSQIVEKSALGSHRQHWYPIARSVSPNKVFTHVRYNVYPDGGTKRVRIFGYPVSTSFQCPSPTTVSIPALPLTPETFAAYGQVVQGFELFSSAPRGSRVDVLDGGLSTKFHGHPVTTGPSASASGVTVRCGKVDSKLDVTLGSTIDVSELQRHTGSVQGYIPTGSATGKLAGGHLIVVALANADGSPDLNSLRAFMATTAQGVLFNAGTWHQKHFAVNQPLSYASVTFGTDTSALQTASVALQVEIQPYGVITREKRNKKLSRKQALRHPSLPPLPAINGPPIPQSSSTISRFGLGSLLPTSLTTTSNGIQPVPITAKAFAPYGKIISENSSATLSLGSCASVSVLRAITGPQLARGQMFDVKMMEKTDAEVALVPLSKGEWKGTGEPALPRGGVMLVIVAKNGKDGRPDPSSMKSFLVESNIGIVYAPGVWYHPVMALDAALDVVHIEASSNDDEENERIVEAWACEGDDEDEEEEGEDKVFGRVSVPTSQ